MDKLIFYKLESPYSGDTTKNCDLEVTDIDSNFITIKNDAIKEITFDEENYLLNVVKNSGETISVDISSIKDYVDEKVSEAESGESGSSFIENISLDLTDEGVLTLTWPGESGDTGTSVSGLVTTAMTSGMTAFSDGVTIKGNGIKSNPFRAVLKESIYNNVKGIIDTLPANASNGDRYITKNENVSVYGTLYTIEGMEKIKEMLVNENSLWRVPSKDDWDDFLSSIDQTTEGYYISGETVDEQGVSAGKTLKATTGWDSKTSTDKIGFAIYPTLFANENKELILEPQQARFWTDTIYEGSTEKKGCHYMKKFNDSKDTVGQFVEKDKDMCSLRLVMDYDGDSFDSSATILGMNYKVCYNKLSKQVWMKVNLDKSLGSEDLSKKFEYDGDTVSTKYYINNYNGFSWETKELENCDNVSIISENGNTEYKVLITDDGNTKLVKAGEIKNGKVVYDAGEY